MIWIIIGIVLFLLFFVFLWLFIMGADESRRPRKIDNEERKK